MENSPGPVHGLVQILQKNRREEIVRLANGSEDVTGSSLQHLAFVQLALTAVREEIAENEKQLGGGSEIPLS